MLRIRYVMSHLLKGFPQKYIEKWYNCNFLNCLVFRNELKDAWKIKIKTPSEGVRAGMEILNMFL